MKTLLVLACLVAAVLAAEKSTYSTKYDNFDVDTLIQNDRLLKAYVNCFLDKGRCTPEGSEFKKYLPDALKSSCAKCSDKQKGNIRKVIRAIQSKHARSWEDLLKKNDPTGEHRPKFDEFIAAN